MPSVVRIVSGYDYGMAEQATAEETTVASQRERCCSAYHAAIELIGKRWTGAIVFVLLDGPLRFSEVKMLVPDLSDRLLSERLKELESEGIVERRTSHDLPVRIEYSLTEKGRALEPAVRSLKVWARSWL
ncbi:MAG: winged helix-turn-helix transcriptional regulator [Thermoleophilaceae bacterium]